MTTTDFSLPVFLAAFKSGKDSYPIKLSLDFLTKRMAKVLSKLLIIGASGLLGSRLMSQARSKYEVTGCCNPIVDGEDTGISEHLDIGSRGQIENLFHRIRPDAVILAAAMTNVDGCERNPDLAYSVNAKGPEYVADCCRRIGSKLAYVSTDYVFNGKKIGRYSEDDQPDPISVYASTKLAGERAVSSILPDAIIARPAVLYGWNPVSKKDNFVTWVLKKLRKGEQVNLFEDQYTSPTFADDLAKTLLDLVEKDVAGIWNVSGPDCMNRPACGTLIARIFGLDWTLVTPVLSDSIPLPAKRPKNTCLNVAKVENLLRRKTMSFEDGVLKMKEQEGILL